MFEASGKPLHITPSPHPDNDAEWRETGTHNFYDFEKRTERICGCGPSNHLSGPQWATYNGVEYREDGYVF